MIKVKKPRVKIKGKKDDICSEITVLLYDFIELFGINTLKECVEDLQIITNYKVTLQELEVPNNIEKEIMKFLKTRKK